MISMLETILRQKNMSLYQCAKISGVPYTTVSEIVRGKTTLNKCSAETVYKLSKALDVKMEKLIEDSLEPRPDFEVFKSNICHLVKDNGDLNFIISELQSDDINRYWEKKWYAEAFYLLAMVDYLSRINNIPLCNKYEYIRSRSLKDTLYPKDVIMTYLLDPQSDVKKRSRDESIPEFMRFNIVESEVRNVY